MECLLPLPVEDDSATVLNAKLSSYLDVLHVGHSLAAATGLIHGELKLESPETRAMQGMTPNERDYYEAWKERGFLRTHSEERYPSIALAILPDSTDPSAEEYHCDTLNPQRLTVGRLDGLPAATNSIHHLAEHNLCNDPSSRNTAVQDLVDARPHIEEGGTLDSAQTTPSDDGYQQGKRAQKSQDLTPDILDRLFESLNGRPQADAEDRLSQFHIWPSIRFVETTLGDDTATWSPQHCSTVLDTARYQVLPYFASYHWQLAVSDQIGHVIARYDCAWQDGCDRFTFAVLEKWLHSNGGNPFDRPYEYDMVKVSPPRHTCPLI
ncbi:hypothetical protein LTR74_018411 [Friedmanniomyces endolithicus]|nr:hypothetical protein LTR74_018411 [Friedmanniomyces endolithicus]